MTNHSTTPKDITVSLSAQTLTLVWADDHISVYPLESLRRACPCVACKGGHANMSQPVDPAIFKATPTQTWQITELKTAGNYGLQIVWADGHSEGIFRWQTLRQWDAYL